MKEKNNAIQENQKGSDTAEQHGQDNNLLGDDAFVVDESGTLTIDFFGDLKAKKDEEKKKKEEELLKKEDALEKKDQKNKQVSKSKKKEEIKITKDWIIAYAAENFRVSEFINTLEDDEEIVVENLREKMELEFFELSKERTHFEFDKERKIIFPIVKGTDKGSGVDPNRFHWLSKSVLKESKRIQYIPGTDGQVYEIKDGLLGRMISKAYQIPGLDVIKEGFKYKLPKISGDVLSQVISFFRDYCTSNGEYEVMVQVFWDREDSTYMLHVPVQVVTKGSVRAQYDNFVTNPRYQLVMEIHSHNSMKAFFSHIDDSNEIAYMLYGVIGNLNQQEVSMKLRVGYNGKFMPLSLNYIFDSIDLMAKDRTYPSAWHNKVTLGCHIERG